MAALVKCALRHRSVGGPLTNSVSAAGDEGDENAVKEVREVVKQLQARYEKTKDLQADFTQKTTIEGFERPLRHRERSISKSLAGYGGIISTLRSRTSMSIGMMSKCMCRSTNKCW